MLPWKDTSREPNPFPTMERGRRPFLCRSISRKTGYKQVDTSCGDWRDWEIEVEHRTAIPTPRLSRLIRAKGEHPTWGPKKLVAWLGRVEPWMNWPASSTAGQILDRALVGRRKRRRHTAPWSEPFAAAERPNEVWSIQGLVSDGRWGQDRPIDYPGRL